MKKLISVILSFTLIFFSLPFNAYAVSVDTMKSTVVSVAENEVGYEGTGSYSKYGEWYGYQGAWCTTFALWCFNKAGEKLGVKLYSKIVPSGGNCNSMISWYQNKGRYHTRGSGYTPSKGDLVFFDWSGNGSSQHVGIVSGTSGSTVYTVEGNCSGKVKAKTYTTSGSKPYGNVSSIMGYGSPNWGSVGSGGSEETTAKPTTTTTKQTTTTTAPPTTEKKTSQQSTETATKSTTESTTETTTETTTAPPVLAKDMTIHAATTDLEIGDSVELDYTIKPLGASAVVGYFCDEENIIEISDGGVITATGEGTATVVVCANDEIYRQCDFVVKGNTAEVTRKTPIDQSVHSPVTTQNVVKTKEQVLAEIGINSEKLLSHNNNYLIPICIIGATAVLSLSILAVKAVARSLRKRKTETESDEQEE